MAELRLNPSVRKQVEKALGESVPEPNSPEFQGFLEELRQERPDLHRDVVNHLVVTGDPLPAEQEAHKAARRNRINALLRQLLYHRTFVGDYVLDKRRVMTLVLAVLALALPLMSLLSGGLLGSRGVAEAQELDGSVHAASMTVPDESGELEMEEPSSPSPFAQTLPSSLYAQQPVSVTPAPGALSPATTAPGSPEASPAGSLPPPPAPSQPHVAAPPTYPPATTAPSGSGQANEPPPLTVALQEKPAAPSLTVYSQPQSAPPAFGTPSQSPLALTHSSVPPASPSSLSVYQRDSEAPRSVVAYTAEAEPRETIPMTLPQASNSAEAPTLAGTGAQQGLMVYQAQADTAAPLQPAAQAPQESTAQTATQGAPAALPSPPAPVQAHNSGGLPAPQPVQAEALATPMSLASLVQPGARIPAHLATGVVVTDGSSTPVVAETSGDWCGTEECPDVTWIGQASLSGPDRISIQFTQAVVGTEVQNVSAVAFSPDNTPGLAAAVSDSAPTAVQDLLRTSVGAASDYLNALNNQRRITIVDGIVIDEAQVPDLGTFVLGRAASLFDLPADRTSVVRVAQVSPGTPLIVLYGVQ